MATVKIDRFGGIAPRQHPTQLADGMAVTAMNVVLTAASAKNAEVEMAKIAALQAASAVTNAAASSATTNAVPATVEATPEAK